jgi:hypothetical protein
MIHDQKVKKILWLNEKSLLYTTKDKKQPSQYWAIETNLNSFELIPVLQHNYEKFKQWKSERESTSIKYDRAIRI